MEWFKKILDQMEKAITPFEPAIEAVESIAETAAPIIATAVPSLAPEIAITTAVIARGRALIAAATPEVVELGNIFDSLAHLTATPQGVNVAAKTTIATVPAPGAALT